MSMDHDHSQHRQQHHHDGSLTPERHHRNEEEYKAYYSALSTPVLRDDDSISGSLEDKLHCTFKPWISARTRKMFPTNGSFLERLEGYTQHYAQSKDKDPDLGPDCTFRPRLSLSGKSGPVASEPFADRMSKYTYRKTAEQASLPYPFKPQLKLLPSKDNRTFLERLDEDNKRRERARTAKSHVAEERSVSSAASREEFESRMEADLKTRRERYEARNELLQVGKTDDPSKRRINIDKVTKELAELYGHR